MPTWPHRSQCSLWLNALQIANPVHPACEQSDSHVKFRWRLDRPQEVEILPFQLWINMQNKANDKIGKMVPASLPRAGAYHTRSAQYSGASLPRCIGKANACPGPRPGNSTTSERNRQVLSTPKHKNAKQSQIQNRQTSVPTHIYPHCHKRASVPKHERHRRSADDGKPIDTLQHGIGCRPERVERVEGAPPSDGQMCKTNPISI